MSKYFKPKSVTWWMGVIPVVCGLFMAAEPLHGQAEYVAALSNMYGGADAAILINSGLAAIGLRAAV